MGILYLIKLRKTSDSIGHVKRLLKSIEFIHGGNFLKFQLNLRIVTVVLFKTFLRKVTLIYVKLQCKTHKNTNFVNL